MTEKRIHEELADFGSIVLVMLKKRRFFDHPYEALPASFWRQLVRESRKKNEKVFDLIFESVTKPELAKTLKRVQKMKEKELGQK